MVGPLTRSRILARHDRESRARICTVQVHDRNINRLNLRCCPAAAALVDGRILYLNTYSSRMYIIIIYYYHYHYYDGRMLRHQVTRLYIIHLYLPYNSGRHSK
jgi:hypothetical protein